jgi:hypothetical protein
VIVPWWHCLAIAVLTIVGSSNAQVRRRRRLAAGKRNAS